MATDLRQQLGQVLVKVQQGVVTTEDLWRKLISFRSKEELQACINYGLTVGLFRYMPNGKLYWTKKSVAEALAGVSELDPDKLRPVPPPKKRQAVVKPLSAPSVDHTVPLLPGNLAEGKPLPYFRYAFMAKIACSLVESGEKFHANHLVSKIKRLGYGAEDLDVRATETLKLIARQGYPKGGPKIIEKESYGKAWYISRVVRVSDADLLRDLQGANMQKEAPPVSKAQLILNWAASRHEAAFSMEDLYEARELVGYSQGTALTTLRGALNYLVYTALKKPSDRDAIVTVARGRYALASRKDEAAYVKMKHEAPVVSHTRKGELKKARTQLNKRKKRIQVQLAGKEIRCKELKEEISKIDRELAALNDI